MTTSEDNYWLGDDLYDKIKDNFYEIENSNGDNIDLIEMTIDDAEEALEIIEKINLKVLKKLYNENIYVITKNVEQFKEQADYVLTTLKKIKEKMRKKPVPPEMWADKDRESWEDQKKEREKAGIEDTKIEFDILGEGFMSLEYFKKNILKLED